ncbi:MAG: zf-HC2 domain-containing protein [Pyrinomonadaceae bacterium]
MTKRCLDEGLLQAYIDGELSHEKTAEAATHIAACAACAAALAELESENNIFASAFAPDESISVPTELLRSRIGAAVAQLEDAHGFDQKRSGGWSFGGFLASLSGLFNFTPQRAAGFATLLAVVTAGVIYFAVVKPRPTTDSPRPSREVASSDAPTAGPKESVKATPDVKESFNAPAPTPEKRGAKPVIVNAVYTPRRRANRTDEARPTNVAPKVQRLPGEKDYQSAIASLENTIKMGGDASLKPAVRVAYERNLAILDSAIAQTRQVATQNPKDKDAVGFLMSAYQSKVELLTKVADQAQVSALGR